MLRGVCWKDGCNSLTNFIWVDKVGVEIREFFACSRLHAGAFADLKVFDEFEGDRFREISSRRSIESELVEELDLVDLAEVEEDSPSSKLSLRAARVVEEIKRRAQADAEEETHIGEVEPELSNAAGLPCDRGLFDSPEEWVGEGSQSVEVDSRA